MRYDLTDGHRKFSTSVMEAFITKLSYHAHKPAQRSYDFVQFTIKSRNL